MSRYALILLVVSATAAAVAEPHERMMKATFKVVGDSKKFADSKESVAAFAVALADNEGGRLGNPSASPPASPSAPPRNGRGRKLAFITAAHFFDNVEGDRIEIVARQHYYGEDYQRVPYPVMLRGGEREIPLRHPDPNVDAAAIILDWPDRFDVQPLTLEQFGTTETIASAVHPGRSIFSVGFPFAIESPESGFPVLRHGYVASYPPPRAAQFTFLGDMSMSQGYSGAPVYVPEYRGGKYDFDKPLLLGMVVGQHELTSEFKGPFETRTVRYPLDLAIIVQAAELRKLVQKALE
jgi:hypothetical protein